MRKTPLLAAIVLGVAVGAPGFAAAVETNSPSRPPQHAQPVRRHDHQAEDQKAENQLGREISGWLAHRLRLIFDKGDYVGGIAALRAMGYDDNVDVATLIGYASRKLQGATATRYWYDKALAADPNHALTWSYYGMWQAEQGNLLKAKDDLEKVRADLRQHRMPRICCAQGRDRRHQDVLIDYRFPDAVQRSASGALLIRDRHRTPSL